MQEEYALATREIERQRKLHGNNVASDTDLGLPNGLVTGYGRAIPLRQEMPCTVRITTEEKRVLQRVFGRLHDLLKR